MIGDRVARARTKARLTQDKLGKAVGKSRAWVAAVEAGNIRRPDPHMLAALSRELGLDYRELLAVTDQLGALESPTAPTPDADLASAVRELVEEVRLSRQAQERTAEVLVDLIGMVAQGRLPQSGSAAADASPVPLGNGQR